MKERMLGLDTAIDEFGKIRLLNLLFNISAYDTLAEGLSNTITDVLISLNNWEKIPEDSSYESWIQHEAFEYTALNIQRLLYTKQIDIPLFNVRMFAKDYASLKKSIINFESVFKEINISLIEAFKEREDFIALVKCYSQQSEDSIECIASKAMEDIINTSNKWFSKYAQHVYFKLLK